MGWASGSRIMSEIIESVMENVSDEAEREDLYSDLIGIFEDFDCDTLHECLEIDEAYDAAFHEKYPDDEEEELEDPEDWDDQSGGSF